MLLCLVLALIGLTYWILFFDLKEAVLDRWDFLAKAKVVFEILGD